MKANPTLFAAIGLLFVAAVTAVVMLNKDSGTPSSSAAGATATSAASRAAVDGSGAASPTNRSGSTKARDRQAAANAELIAKYGEARTNLSKHVSANVTGIMDDAIQMVEMMNSSPNGGFGGGLGMALGSLNGELQLTPEQSEKAKALYQEHQKRKSESYRAAVELLKKDPTSLMKLMLASDASARSEMTDEEYKKVQADAGKSLTGIINPLDRKNFGGGSPLRDPDFVSGMKGILDPTQNGKLDETMAKRQADAASDPTTVPGVEEGNIAGLPKMELEKLDQSIESARKVTTGIKSMMDGMGGLREMMQQPAPAGEN
jgi:hypothetical protein